MTDPNGDEAAASASVPPPPPTANTAAMSVMVGDDDGRKIPRKQVVSWAFWDWATQPFNSVILTFVFAPLYLVSAHFLSPELAALPVDSPERITALAKLSSQYGAWTAIAGLLIFALAPVLGVRSDATGGRKRWLVSFTALLALVQFALFFVYEDPAYFTYGAIILALGSVVNEIAGVNYNAMLHQVSTPSTAGRVSGLGWGLGYLGGVVALIIVVVVTQLEWFGLDVSGGLAYRLIALGAAIWTIVFAIPLVLNVPEHKVIDDRPKVGFFSSYVELVKDMIALFQQSRPTFWFLFASAIYRDGLAGVFAFGGILAAVGFGFTSNEVMIFGLAANIVAGVSTILAGRLDDRFGAKAVIVTALGGLVVMGLFVFFARDLGVIAFWIGGLALSMFTGPAQAASRSLLTRVTPSSMQGEVFGLYATTGRVASILSPAAWTIFVTAFASTVFGVIGIVLVLAVGLTLLIFVKLPKGSVATGSFVHLSGWNIDVLRGLTLALFVGVGAAIFSVTGAGFIPGGFIVSAVLFLIAASSAILALRGLARLRTSGESGAGVGKATVVLGALALVGAVLALLTQFGILPALTLG
ncbi:MFS transporter [Protaetiibacter intestinalis]|uniref:MFS transporter n=1 Tax=Protaetiibacter intestinalis TaxID=2419774 RepID=A0A387B301_9MICO|nr:MFS transporter [Protaetiibacter intestinalis]AYF97922.1 MFS transporter [Protaetiibacter intestinalis]